MRGRHFAAALALCLTVSGVAEASGGRCVLDSVIGYQLVFSKPIVGRIQNGRREAGYDGCEVDRVLVFADNTGVRCKEVLIQHRDEPPAAYLFAKSQSDLRLCVEGEIIVVSPTN